MVQSKKSWGVLVIVTILVVTIVASLFLIQAPASIEKSDPSTANVSYMQMSDQEKVLSALKDVVGIDVDKYNVNVTHYDFEPDLRFKEEDESPFKYNRQIIFNLESKESQLVIFSMISKKDNSLITFDVNVLYGTRSSIHYINKLSSDPLAATKEFLSRLYAFTETPIIKDMQTLVEPAKNLGDMNKTVGDIKCKAMEYTQLYAAPEIHIDFLQLFSGIESTLGLSINFCDGFFWSFGNGWDSRSAGSVEVNVSREQALAVAKQEVIRAVGSSDLTFPSDSSAIVELTMQSADRSFVSPLYLFWSVTLYFAHPSDSWLGGWHVWLRADTGEIVSSGPIHGHPYVDL